MEKSRLNPMREPSWRSSRTQKEWKVDIQACATLGVCTRRWTRPRISWGGFIGKSDCQQAFGKYAAIVDQVGNAVGNHPRLATPRPARIRRGPSIASTASRCWGFSWSSMFIGSAIFRVHSKLQSTPSQNPARCSVRRGSLLPFKYQSKPPPPSPPRSREPKAGDR